MNKDIINQYPIFIISYNRAKNHTTAKELAKYGIKHFMVVHKEQIAEYKKYMTAEMQKYTTFLEFDENYKYKYETCDNIPHTIKNAGSGAERNFAWDYSIKIGANAHWLLDDNMTFYEIIGKSKKGVYKRKRCTKKGFINNWHKAEHFFNKYENLLMLELKQKDFTINLFTKTYSLNTRCFSCNLIYNNMPLRWRGRYNEDVILSTDIMYAGYCIASYHGGVLKSKQSTRSAIGGNHKIKEGDTNSLYADGFDYRNSSIDKTNLLLKVYPKYYKKVIKYGRVHHEYNRKTLKEIASTSLIQAKEYGRKSINSKNFKKIKHYPIPKGNK